VADRLNNTVREEIEKPNWSVRVLWLPNGDGGGFHVAAGGCTRPWGASWKPREYNLKPTTAYPAAQLSSADFAARIDVSPEPGQWTWQIVRASGTR